MSQSNIFLKKGFHFSCCSIPVALHRAFVSDPNIDRFNVYFVGRRSEKVYVSCKLMKMSAIKDGPLLRHIMEYTDIVLHN